MSPPLSCPVRRCHLPLERSARTWTCPRSHSFDIARRGYVNLLQPQDRRSPAAGDSRESVEARARLLSAGIGRRVVAAFVSRAAALVSQADVVVDLGCGAGDALAMLGSTRPVTAVGIDLSPVAAAAAARRFPAATWVVANADRRLPLLDESVALVLSLHARRNRDECRRVLRGAGYLLIAVPAADDLVELRAAVQGARVERDRVADTIAGHAPDFEVVDQGGARELHELSGEQLRDALTGTYRGARTSDAARAGRLDRLRVTVASDFILLRRR